MGADSKIAWTNHTFNPWIGCQRVSPGCTNCYAESQDSRKRWGGEVHWGPTAPRFRTSVSTWRKPLTWNKRAELTGVRERVFCASLADVFEDRAELEPWRCDLFKLIDATPNLDWLLLTKRPENVGPMLPSWRQHQSMWPNVWLGTTVEDRERRERIGRLLEVPAVVHFVSCEPLLQAVNLIPMLGTWRGSDDKLIPGIDWVIIGGESGPNARRFEVDWARDLVKQCERSGAAAFVKQMGANIVTRNDDGLTSDYSEGGWFLHAEDQVEDNINGFREDYQGADVRIRLRDRAGADPAEWPEDLRVREFPEVNRG